MSPQEPSGKSRSPTDPRSSGGESKLEPLFVGLLGGCLGLALLKFGNPVTVDRLVDQPNGVWEWVFQPWPVKWGFGLLVCSVVAGLGVLRIERARPIWLAVLPLIWLGWQGVAAVKTVDGTLSIPTFCHFIACLVCLYLGWIGLSRVRRMWPFWAGLLAGFILVLWIGFEQHYGGLEATRRHFYEQPNWQQYPPEYLKRIASDRIFSTLVYPNALAGAILLLLPILLSVIWINSARVSPIVRKVLAGLFLYGGLACLYWSGSKAGWLIALTLTMGLLLRMRFSSRLKWVLAVCVITAGLAGFAVKFAPYFRKGATSVSARLGYWRAAFIIARENPVFGTGPGTFAVPFRKIKPPEAEMARLVHNDYLEQASDSGIVGFLSYSGFVVGSIVFLGRRHFHNTGLFFPCWLGLCGWALQGLVEFALYIPGISWPAFALLGWLLGQATEDKSYRQMRCRRVTSPPTR